MVPLRRVKLPKYGAPIFFAGDRDISRWIEKHKATIEFTVGYVYRSGSPCPKGAVPLYSVFDVKIGQLLTVSESERDLCIRLGARNFGMQCYVAPP